MSSKSQTQITDCGNVGMRGRAGTDGVEVYMQVSLVSSRHTIELRLRSAPCGVLVHCRRGRPACSSETNPWSLWHCAAACAPLRRPGPLQTRAEHG
jgi:hypothetical protein